MKDTKEKVLAEIERRGLTSHMSQTKWNIVLPLLKPVGAEINLKWLLSCDQTGWSSNYLIPAQGYFEETHLGPITFREIEWLELKSHDSERLSKILDENNIPHSFEDNIYKIWGYSNHRVDFV